MAHLNITWRFYREVEENSTKFTVVIGASESIKKLKEKITTQVKEIERYANIEIDDLNLKLWKANIPDDDIEKFLNLRLQNDENRNTEKLEESKVVGDYWGTPEEGYSHVIVTSNYLMLKRENELLKREIQDLRREIQDLREEIQNLREYIKSNINGKSRRNKKVGMCVT